MTPSDAGKVLNAAVLEVMPERHCSKCLEPVPISARSSAHPFEDKGGFVVLFWCDTCGAKPRAEA